MKSLSKFINGARTAAVAATLSLVSAVSYAENDNIGIDLLDGAKDGLVGIIDPLVTLLQVILGLGGLVCLVMVIYKIIKGDREAAEKLAWWIAGLTLGFVLITVVRGIIPS